MECPNCATPSVVPTIITRASQIADRVENMLIKQDYVPGTTFMRLSTTGASTRMEVLRALCIVTAQTFQAAFRHPGISDARKQLFDKFANGAGGAAMHLAVHLVPDSELALISRLYSSDTLGDIRRDESLSDDEKMQRMQRKLEFSQEEQRLQSLVMSDAAWKQLERMESFIAFLKTLNLAGEDYWPIVYRRIGLACPLSEVPDEPVGQPQPEKPWWQRLFG
jgi:hypothetical protein